MLTINLYPFPELTSKRLLLRQITPVDTAAILALHSNATVMRYIPMPVFTTMQHAQAFIEKIDAKMLTGEWINWAITLKGNAPMIGIAGLYKIQAQHHRCQLGYMLLTDYTGQGISTEATGLMLQFAFEKLNMHSVEALIDPRNIASEKVLQKNGFIKEAHLTENVMYNDEFSDTVIYSLLKRNYQK